MNPLFRKSILAATKQLIGCGAYGDRATIESKRIVDNCPEWHPIACECGDWRKVENMPCQFRPGDEVESRQDGYTVRTISAEIVFPFVLDLTTSYRIVLKGSHWSIDKWEPGTASTSVSVSRKFS